MDSRGNRSGGHAAHLRQTGRRRAGAGGLAAVLAAGALPGIALFGSADAAVTVGTNISVFPNRDMVVAVGYNAGEVLTVDVLRGDVVIGTTTGPAVSTPEGVGLEVNHGPLGAAQPGDCWTDYTPDIVGGDTVRVTSPRGVDTSVVKDIDFTGDPYLDGTNVSIEGTAAAGTTSGDFGVEFRRDKPEPRFRGGPLAPVFTSPTTWKATYRVVEGTDGLTADEQREILVSTASWAAVDDRVTETTLAEHGEPGGVAAGCPGTADPNSIAAGYDKPINITSGDVTLSGTAREGVASVSIEVGTLAAKPATLSTNTTGTKTWTLPVTKDELLTLPDGTVTVTPTFDGLVGTARTILKDVVAPLAPTATPAAGTYAGTQNVALVKPTGEGLGKTHWEIGSATTVTDPDALSPVYSTQIAVSSTQTIKARVIDPAGNLGAVGTFDYRIGTPPAAPTGLTAREALGGIALSWAPVTGATGYDVYRGTGTSPVNTAPLTGTTFTDEPLADGTYGYAVRAVDANGLESAGSATASATLAKPATPRGVNAAAGDRRVDVTWTAGTEADLARYELLREGRTTVTVAETQSAYADTGLVNGTTYTYSLVAVDDAGNRSGASGSVQATPAPPPVTAPGAPTIGTPTAGDASATVRWTAPTTTGGSDITGYTVRAYSGTELAGTTTVGNVTSTVISGLANGTAYTFDVAATNSAGTGAASARSTAVTPADTTAPPAPTVTPDSGTYTSAQSVTMAVSETGAVVRYTVGTGTTVPADPTSTSAQYTAPVPVGSSQVIKAAAFDDAGNRSPVVQRSYTISTGTPPTTRTVTVDAQADTMARQASPTTAAGSNATLLSDTEVTSGNAATRATSYVRFTVPTLAAGERISAAGLSVNATDATANGPAVWATGTTWTESTLTWNSGQPSRVGTTAVGNYGSMALGRVSTPVSGVTAAGAVSFQLYAESPDGLNFSSRETTTRPQLVLTITSSGDTAPSDTTAPPAPSVTPASGTYASAQSVTMSVSETGAVVRYTVGTGTTVPADPTSTSAQYTGPVPVGSSQVIKAAAFDAAGNRSPVVQRSYTISTGTPPTTPTTRTVTVDAQADTMARQSLASTAAGSATTLFTDAQIGTSTTSRDTGYLRFTVPTLTTGESITGASLSLNLTNGTANGPAIWRTSTTWTESSLTWNSGQPARSGTAAVGNYGSMGTGRISTPVSGVTTAGPVSFQLYADSTDGIDFSSRESTTVPQLVLTITTG